MHVRDIMSKPVVTVPPEATLHDAIGRMLEQRVGSAVVVDRGPSGIITRSDVLRVAYTEGAGLSELSVRTGMSANLVTILPSATVEKSLRRMESHDIKKLPVIDDLELVGIVTMTDIAQQQPARVEQARGEMERKDEWT